MQDKAVAVLKRAAKKSGDADVIAVPRNLKLVPFDKPHMLDHVYA